MTVVEKGHNYGWPIYHGAANGPGCTAPVVQSGSETWAPSGACFYTGRAFLAWKSCFFFACLRGEAIGCIQTDPANPRRIAAMHWALRRQFGWLRAMAQGPDGYLHLTTSNTDSRGKPGPNDDGILRIVPAKRP
jgi:glucose/arabinose dehydrogenase